MVRCRALLYRHKADVAFDPSQAIVLLDQDQQTDDSEVAKVIVEKVRLAMPGFLQREKLRQFVPLKRPSLESREGVFEVIFYHDDELHDQIFTTTSAASLPSDLSELYVQNGFPGGFEDEAAKAQTRKEEE